MSIVSSYFPSCTYLRVVHPLSQSHRIDADIDMTTLVHKL